MYCNYQVEYSRRRPSSVSCLGFPLSFVVSMHPGYNAPRLEGHRRETFCSCTTAGVSRYVCFIGAYDRTKVWLHTHKIVPDTHRESSRHPTGVTAYTCPPGGTLPQRQEHVQVTWVGCGCCVCSTRGPLWNEFLLQYASLWVTLRPRSSHAFFVRSSDSPRAACA